MKTRDVEDDRTRAVLNLCAITEPDDEIIDFIELSFQQGWGIWTTAKRLFTYLGKDS